jgi:hypothetical protein
LPRRGGDRGRREHDAGAERRARRLVQPRDLVVGERRDLAAVTSRETKIDGRILGDETVSNSRAEHSTEVLRDNLHRGRREVEPGDQRLDAARTDAADLTLAELVENVTKTVLCCRSRPIPPGLPFWVYSAMALV